MAAHPIAPDFEALGWPWNALDREHRLSELGWLPHSSTPWRIIEKLPETEVSAAMARFCCESWSAIRRFFEESIDRCEVDSEAKATFREALEAHEIGLYRTVPRTLFPEIERVSRIEFPDAPPRSFASQRELRAWLGHLLPRDVAPPGMVGWELSKRLMKQLYKNAEDSMSLDAMRLDPVPNRHAAIHGLISYSTLQSSFNALVMTDFAFQVICIVKERRRRKA